MGIEGGMEHVVHETCLNHATVGPGSESEVLWWVVMENKGNKKRIGKHITYCPRFQSRQGRGEAAGCCSH